MRKILLLFLILTFPALGCYLYYWGEAEELADFSQVLSSVDEQKENGDLKRTPSSVILRFAHSVADSKCSSAGCLAQGSHEEIVIPENEEEEVLAEENNLLCDKEDVRSECTYVCGSDGDNETGVLIKQEEESEENDACECSDPKAKWNPTLNRCLGGEPKGEG